MRSLGDTAAYMITVSIHAVFIQIQMSKNKEAVANYNRLDSMFKETFQSKMNGIC